MNFSNYKKILLDASKDLTLQGIIINPSFSAELTNFSCQDSILITGIMSVDQTVSDIKFESSGCILSRGAASLLLANFLGKTLNYIKDFSEEDFLKIILVDDFSARKDCFLLGLNAIKNYKLIAQAK